ncbi:Signal transducing adaptor molecule [Echinococcus multilocularis]|uniref:Signal transducing adaptor molecule n=1 Tax=Echinococcus multilocularis TaxID=6211 RepID=A0A068Y1Z4_ECHMU|nr:Signal transducing adaptor molecule [Echinococcus multilocularis]
MEVAIEKCCDPKTLDDNWAQILHISDTYAVGQPKQCLKCIMRKIFQQNPNVTMKAITLLDACVKNAGNPFAREMSSKDFVSTFKQKYPKLQAIPRLKLIELTKQWAEDYKDNPEFSLLAALYMWIKHEHPSHVRELERSLNATKNKRIDRNLQVKEEEDIAKAIALSLNDAKNATPQGQVQLQSSASTAYPTLQSNVAISNGKKDLGCVRALFDFEAAEDNELTFKAGDVFSLLDDSDPNWWKGSNHNGEGLFPAQFVTRDFDGEKEKVETKNGVKGENDAVETSQKPVKIDPQLVENCLEMLGDADTTGVSRPDPEDLPAMEQQCRAMEPLIEAELEGVYTRISEVDALKQRLTEALAQYHEMVTARTMAAQSQPSQLFPQTVAAGFPNPTLNSSGGYGFGGQGAVPSAAYPQSMIYQPVPAPKPPTGNPPYQPAPVPQPMPPAAVPAVGTGGVPTMYGAPMPMYGQPPPAYGYTMDPNAWQQQPIPPQVQPTHPNLQQPVPPQHMQNPTVYGDSSDADDEAAPPTNPSAAAYNVG